MKLKIKTVNFIFALALLFALGACQNMLDTNSDRLMFENENKLNSPNDSVYSFIGILSQLQKVGERYILFGELRGDLMTTTDNASVALKELAGFNPSPDNIYMDKRDYYNVINNCNYYISRVDTNITINQDKVMIPEYAAIKTIRAWTYWQLAQIFGSVSYFERPILSLGESQANYPVIGIDELADILIKDLLPYQSVRQIDYGSLEYKATSQMVIPVQMLLGDLYLYQNKYQEAASMYQKLMFNNRYIISQQYTNTYTNATGDACDSSHFKSYTNELISEIAFSNQIQYLSSDLVNITYNDKASLIPAKNFVNDMSTAINVYADAQGGAITAYFEGDLRGSIKIKGAEFGDCFQSYMQTGDAEFITKYRNNASVTGYAPENWNNKLLTAPVYLRDIPIYRQPHLYLRYAEAINRMGKPSFAFAALKYGLNRNNIINPSLIDSTEVANLPSYMDFTDYRFNNNVGTASRGRGYGIFRDQSIFVIPNLGTQQDSIEWVETQILNELAAETAFEGNRFFDLLCVSRHRNNHPAFMGEMIGRKLNDPALTERLKSNINEWFYK